MRESLVSSPEDGSYCERYVVDQQVDPVRDSAAWIGSHDRKGSPSVIETWNDWTFVIEGEFNGEPIQPVLRSDP